MENKKNHHTNNNDYGKQSLIEAYNGAFLYGEWLSILITHKLTNFISFKRVNDVYERPKGNNTRLCPSNVPSYPFLVAHCYMQQQVEQSYLQHCLRVDGLAAAPGPTLPAGRQSGEGRADHNSEQHVPSAFQMDAAGLGRSDDHRHTCCCSKFSVGLRLRDNMSVKCAFLPLKHNYIS